MKAHHLESEGGEVECECTRSLPVIFDRSICSSFKFELEDESAAVVDEFLESRGLPRTWWWWWWWWLKESGATDAKKDYFGTNDKERVEKS